MPRVFITSSIYDVKSGDNLTAIATSHGLSWAQIMEVNPGLLDHPDLIDVGMQILIPGDLAPPEPELVAPPASPVVEAPAEQHVVASGDTLGAIAAQWGLSSDTVAAFNSIPHPARIAHGQLIRHS